MGCEEAHEMIRTAAKVALEYKNEEDVKRVIALFVGQAALNDDTIIQSACGQYYGLS